MAGINLIPQLKKPRTERGTSVGGFGAWDPSAGEGGILDKIKASLRFGGGGDREDLDSEAASDDEFTTEDKAYLLRFLLGIGLIFGGKALVQNYTERLTAETQAQLDEKQQELAAENSKLASLQNVQAELQDFERQMASLRRRLELIQGVSRNRNLVIRAVDYAITEMPESVWLKSLELSLVESPRIEVQGYALSNQVISEYVKRLEGGVFFPSWNLVETSSEQTPARPLAGAAPSSTSAPGAAGSPPTIGAKRFSINAKVVPL